MTVKELIEHLHKFPPSQVVMMWVFDEQNDTATVEPITRVIHSDCGDWLELTNIKEDVSLLLWPRD